MQALDRSQDLGLAGELFQAENDFDLAPSKTLLAEMQLAGKQGELKIYPPHGVSRREGHGFAYMGSSTWFRDMLAFLQTHCTRPPAAAGR